MLNPGVRLLGSSEVIESVFGKLKWLERDQSKSGFTGLLLSVPVTIQRFRKIMRSLVSSHVTMTPGFDLESQTS